MGIAIAAVPLNNARNKLGYCKPRKVAFYVITLRRRIKKYEI